MAAPYIHEVWILDATGSPTKRFGIIPTKKKFRETMIQLFYDTPSCRVGFRLLESPNDSFYEAIPYVNRRGNPALAFMIVDQSQQSCEVDDDAPF